MKYAFGIVGLGHRGLHWLRMLERIEGYRITALCDPIVTLHERALDALADRQGVKVYAGYEDMLGDPQVDAVAVTVRCKEQGELAAMALEAGKHVNTEVPAAHTMEDCWRIVLAQERSGLVYQLGEQTRFLGLHRRLARFGAVGASWDRSRSARGSTSAIMARASFFKTLIQESLPQ